MYWKIYKPLQHTPLPIVSVEKYIVITTKLYSEFDVQVTVHRHEVLQ